MPDPLAEVASSVRAGERFDLTEVDPSTTPGFGGDKNEAATLIVASAVEMSDLQERLYAEGTDADGPSVLLVIQGMDTAGKGGIMRHVVGGFDPQGVKIKAFKAPTEEELAHHFLWRVKRELPPPGMIGVFDRSHYEDVLVARVHDLVPEAELRSRYAEIREFEAQLAERGTRIVKVMLHISKDEQAARLSERISRPDKHWKYSPDDVSERSHWSAYMEAYQAAIKQTNAEHAPWYVVPADKKWYARLAVNQLLLETLRAISPQWPAAHFDVTRELNRLAES